VKVDAGGGSRRIVRLAQAEGDRVLAEDAPDGESADDRPDDLRHPVDGQLAPGKALGSREREGDRRVDVAARDLADRVHERGDDEPEGEADGEQVGLGHRRSGLARQGQGGDHRPRADEDQRGCAQHLGQGALWHGVHLFRTPLLLTGVRHCRTDFGKRTCRTCFCQLFSRTPPGLVRLAQGTPLPFRSFHTWKAPAGRPYRVHMTKRLGFALTAALSLALVPAAAFAADAPPPTTADIASDTVWVIVTAVLVMFMQAGFAMLEVGFSRMKNVGTVVAKVITNFSTASIVYWAFGFALAFGASAKWLFPLIGFSGFVPTFSPGSSLDLPAMAASTVPASAKWMFQFVFCAVSLAIVWGTMIERTKFIVYPLFAIPFAGLIYPLISHQL